MLWLSHLWLLKESLHPSLQGGDGPSQASVDLLSWDLCVLHALPSVGLTRARMCFALHPAPGAELWVCGRTGSELFSRITTQATGRSREAFS